MKQILFPLAVVALAAASAPATAGCFAGYKAKQDEPLKLHYGVIELTADTCPSPEGAWDEVAARLRSAGWTLLDVVDVFLEDGLEDRRQNAGANFLRY